MTGSAGAAVMAGTGVDGVAVVGGVWVGVAVGAGCGAGGKVVATVAVVGVVAPTGIVAMVTMGGTVGVVAGTDALGTVGVTVVVVDATVVVVVVEGAVVVVVAVGTVDVVVVDGCVVEVVVVVGSLVFVIVAVQVTGPPTIVVQVGAKIWPTADWYPGLPVSSVMVMRAPAGRSRVQSRSHAPPMRRYWQGLGAVTGAPLSVPWTVMRKADGSARACSTGIGCPLALSQILVMTTVRIGAAGAASILRMTLFKVSAT